MPEDEPKPPAGRKHRTEFRANRGQRARGKNWTRRAHQADGGEWDAVQDERISGRGQLSRKRTIKVDQNDQRIVEAGTRDGIVITVFGAVAQVDDGNRIWLCTVRRILRTLQIRERSPVVVGDRVQFRIESEREGVAAEGVIENVLPRRGELSRVAGRRVHTVVANVDQAVIVTSLGSPKPKPHLLDRYIVAAISGGLTPIVCVNKIDRAEADEVDDLRGMYDRIGYPTLATSAVTGAGIDALRECLNGKTSVIAGQSGVGKSSLLNAVQPELGLAVGTVVHDTQKGRHTTTRGTLLRLNGGGYVVDTPGVKAFDVQCVPTAELERCFVEFMEFIPNCKFPDCTHIHEHECAVRDGVERGDIHPDRYGSYVRLFTNPDYR
ncbi:MAG: ribosome small subunit-dependent GTPase A [Phycisphaerales bacterium]|nr:ribosome small subunit-dependent GTPase A [Phycisphaerales bacterium]